MLKEPPRVTDAAGLVDALEHAAKIAEQYRERERLKAEIETADQRGDNEGVERLRRELAETDDLTIRTCALWALLAVTECAKHLPEMAGRGHLIAPLLDLVAALNDADKGKKNPLLTPAKSKGGRPPWREADAYMAAVVAAAVDHLIKAGMSEREAHRVVAAVLANEGVRLNGAEPDPSHVRTIREGVSGRWDHNDDARDLYRSMAATDPPGKTPDQIKDALRETLRTLRRT